MSFELEALSITYDDLSEITNLDISAVFMGGTIRPSVFRSKGRLLSLLGTEILALGALFIMGLGFALVLVPQKENFNQLRLLVVAIAGAVAVSAVVWHSYQGHRAKTLKTLSRLLDEVDRHNAIIQALQVIDALEAAQAEAQTLTQKPEIIQALEATRKSLVSALLTDKILRHHRPIMDQQSELLNAVETNLAILQTLQLNHQVSEYRQFLQEALDIGLAVRLEMLGRPLPR